ncbi:MAG: potassium transporter TrkG [Nitriliruptorales bacterium]|nr:potassium transporter TrkG [Nitriliruptorales bacterium]
MTNAPRRRSILLVRPSREDLQLVGLYVGKVAFGLGLVQLIPLGVALLQQEWNSATALAIGAAGAMAMGLSAEIRLHSDRQLLWSHGLVTVAAAWLVGAMLLAIPLWLSGHWGSYLDATFEAMSGLTATGLSLTQDIDHLPTSMNLLRHLSQFIGGQGIIIVVLTMFASTSGVGTLYVGEGRDDRIVPNIIRAARFIYLVAGTYLVIGTLALMAAGMVAGLSPIRSLLHSLNLFMASFDTGGFATNSTSIKFYHSAGVEAVVIVLMIAGTLSFGLHYELWRGRRRDLIENIETRSLAVTFLVTCSLLLVALAQVGVLDGMGSSLRTGVFMILSAHTTTGFSTVHPNMIGEHWGLVAPAILVITMSLGGMASSTAGGMKGIRIALAAKSTVRDIRSTLAPDAAVIVTSYRARTRRVLTDGDVRAAMTIIVLFLGTYLLGAVVGVYYGFPLDRALFESVSATANGGLSAGVLSPDNPAVLKATYLVQMWLGRLEFMTAFAMLGYIVAIVRGRR